MKHANGRSGIFLRGGLAATLCFAMVLVGWRYGWQWGVVCSVGVSAPWCWGTLLPTSQLFGPVVTRMHGRGVLITLDDGPDPHDTPIILDTLDRHGVQAVFFLVGDKVAAFPDCAREIVARGHEVGNHSMTHPQGSMWCAGPWRTRREIVECQRTITEVTGVPPRWFRAPVGHRTYFTHPIADELGLEVVAWSRRAFDTVDTNVERMTTRLSDGAKDGDILLLHQGTPVAVELLDQVLARLSASGLLHRG